MLSRQSIDILIDLVEIKLSTMIVQDKEDMREAKRLRNCRTELISISKSINRETIKSHDKSISENNINQFL